MSLDEFTQLTPDDLISSLDNFQQEIVRTLLKVTNGNYLEVADKWLSASPSNTAKFGGEINRSVLYREKVVDEIEKFLCGNDSTYEEERRKLNIQSDKSQKYIVGVMSTAIGGQLGVAGTFIAPIIVLLVISMGKMCINAWCEMRREIKTKTS